MLTPTSAHNLGSFNAIFKPCQTPALASEVETRSAMMRAAATRRMSSVILQLALPDFDCRKYDKKPLPASKASLASKCAEDGCRDKSSAASISDLTLSNRSRITYSVPASEKINGLRQRQQLFLRINRIQ
ncbi:hypothetical protein KC365_g74 [Hortaea werneckii]|nr:hypothetical protein KC339_g70 [Hortaea werneckii]KAI7245876.1 hypothetical protein KC365_g74 [Hortaea werneckii]